MAQNELTGTDLKDSNLSDDVLYNIDVGANRYDLLCLEGIAHSLRVYLGLEKPPCYKVVKPEKMVKLIVDPSVASIRPFACSAVLRNISFTEDSLKSFIDLQDKLHQNICRQRTLCTMGTHDLDTIEGPITFKAEDPKEIIFKALKQKESTGSDVLVENLKKDHKLKKYLHLVEGLSKYPVLRDSKNTVLALPPLINSEHSKITVNTKNVWIDITAHDETKANIVLNILTTMFSIYCKEQFTIEGVEVVNLKNTSVYPVLEENKFKVNIDYLNRISGTNDLKRDCISELLKKMSLKCEFDETNEKDMTIVTPATRSDILHACDIAEDLAIAFGYDNIKKMPCTTICNGQQTPINKLTDLFRQEMAMCGYTEALTFSLISKEDSITRMGGKINDETLKNYVQLLKSKTAEFQLFRTSLIPGLMKTIEKNQLNSLPIRLFEISDVVLLDEKSENGAVNRRFLSFAYGSNNSGFEIIQGVIDQIFQSRLSLEYNNKEDKTKGYWIEPSKDPRFFDDRQCKLFLFDKEVGIFGVINPTINKAFGKIPFPITLAEIDIEYIFDLIISKKI